MQKRHFTLLELMAAMVVLVIMMGFLFKFITSTQDLWSASERNARIYENAQVLFELMARDLTGAVTNANTDRKIGFWIGTADGDGSKDLLTFATMSPCTDESESKLWEVHYRWGKATDATFPYLVCRAVVSDKADSTTKDPNWDFYANGSTTTPPTWANTVGSYQEVIDGVKDIEISFFDASTGNNTPIAGSTTYYTTPSAVKIVLTLVDQKVIEAGFQGAVLASKLDASERKFSKVIFLPR